MYDIYWYINNSGQALPTYVINMCYIHEKKSHKI